MNYSQYFHSQAETYRADFQDLRFDSAGDDVLHERLEEKRGLLLSLLPMMREMPELLLPAFNDGFSFTDIDALNALIRLSPGKFPRWNKLSAAVTLSPWVAANVAHILKQDGGDDFMALAVGIQYLCGQGQHVSATNGEPVEGDDTDEACDDDGADDDDEEMNHEEGNRWLEEQGFEKGGQE